MSDRCPECGAALSQGGACQDHFHALLLLESRLPGGPGKTSHFFAVACYGLQHPDSMGYTAPTLAGLHAAVADILDSRATLEEVRQRTRRQADGARRVVRRADEPAVVWRRGGWAMNVADILTVDTDPHAYAERVTRWAQSIRQTLDASAPPAKTTPAPK